MLGWLGWFQDTNQNENERLIDRHGEIQCEEIQDQEKNEGSGPDIRGPGLASQDQGTVEPTFG